MREREKQALLSVTIIFLVVIFIIWLVGLSLITNLSIAIFWLTCAVLNYGWLKHVVFKKGQLKPTESWLREDEQMLILGALVWPIFLVPMFFLLQKHKALSLGLRFRTPEHLKQ